MSVDRNRRETKEITKEEDREMNVKHKCSFGRNCVLGFEIGMKEEGVEGVEGIVESRMGWKRGITDQNVRWWCRRVKMEIEVNSIIKMMEGGIMICCLSDDCGVDRESIVMSGLSCEMMKLG